MRKSKLLYVRIKYTENGEKKKQLLKVGSEIIAKINGEQENVFIHFIPDLTDIINVYDYGLKCDGKSVFIRDSNNKISLIDTDLIEESFKENNKSAKNVKVKIIKENCLLDETTLVCIVPGEELYLGDASIRGASNSEDIKYITTYKCILNELLDDFALMTLDCGLQLKIPYNTDRYFIKDINSRG